MECPEPIQPNKKAKRGRIKKSKSRNLLERLRDYENDVLSFMGNEDVAFSNNLGENDIWMTKVQMYRVMFFPRVNAHKKIQRLKIFLDNG